MEKSGREEKERERREEKVKKKKTRTGKKTVIPIRTTACIYIHDSSSIDGSFPRLLETNCYVLYILYMGVYIYYVHVLLYTRIRYIQGDSTFMVLQFYRINDEKKRKIYLLFKYT